MALIDTSVARYIKLGPGGAWEADCLAKGLLRLGHSEIPHDLAVTRDRDAIRGRFIDCGMTTGKASDKTRELLAFYDRDEDAVWITFSRGYLWWCRAKAAVTPVTDNWHDLGARWRRTTSPWSNVSVSGAQLLISGLSGRLTRTAGYRQNICDVAEKEYLLHRFNDEWSPAVERAANARQHLTAALRELIAALTWQDFELFVDLLFSTSGWRRTGALGGTQKTVDIELELPSTRERAFVQVKSTTNQAQLDHYTKSFETRGEGRMFYVYHTHTGKAPQSTNGSVTLIGPKRLADMALNSGLTDWLIERAS